MTTPSQSPHSHLFTMRVWQEEIGTKQAEWRGKVQLLSSGEVRYFRQWDALSSLLTMLSELNAGLDPSQQPMPEQ